MVVAVFVTLRLVHQSIAGGMMGLMLPIYAIIPLGLALVAGVVAGRGRSAAGRWASMLVAIAVACGAFTLLRTDGIFGEGGAQITWRWTPTAEERLLARSDDTPAPRRPRRRRHLHQPSRKYRKNSHRRNRLANERRCPRRQLFPRPRRRPCDAEGRLARVPAVPNVTA